ncbi:MAG: hypothetical protein ACK5LJ_17190 [Paracoccus sp. (in: a-proteobacteria)]
MGCWRRVIGFAPNGIRDDSLRLITAGGFAEYYGPLDGPPCGGGRFTWTAAMVIEFLRETA